MLWKINELLITLGLLVGTGCVCTMTYMSVKEHTENKKLTQKQQELVEVSIEQAELVNKGLRNE